MISMQRVLSAVVIGAILSLPLVVGAAASEAQNPTNSRETVRTPKTAQNDAVRSISVWQLPDAPAKVQTTREIIIVAQAPVAPPKTLVCGGWKDSQVGGRYRPCEWL